MKNLDSLKFHYQKAILDKIVPPGLESRVFIAGGALRDYLSGTDIKDIDVFTSDKAAEDMVIAAIIKSGGEKTSENDLLGNFKLEGRWIQVIKGKYYESVQAVIESFDFTICGVGMDGNGNIVTLPSFYQDVLAKHLKVHKITFPLSSLERMQKYIKKGYTACSGTILTLATEINKMDREIFNTSTDSEDNGAVLQNTLMFYPDGTPRFIGVD